MQIYTRGPLNPFTLISGKVLKCLVLLSIKHTVILYFHKSLNQYFPLAGQFALTIKGSALLAYMSMNELLNAVTNVQANSFRYTEGFIIMTVGYWIITVPLITIVRKLENKSNYRM